MAKGSLPSVDEVRNQGQRSNWSLLEKTSAGHQYILVLCDYATRFPEAYPLQSITTPHIIRCLVDMFSRVGIPSELLTDKGTNFTSNLMKQLHRTLGITALKTTPYHPQTDVPREDGFMCEGGNRHYVGLGRQK